ncbi:beta-defensin 121 isoform X2 [Echinops telfairi]|uniref:Beta-defensin 121 isoform X2 n=1 Tax=Echinops telfairi TaxID=9371 RepID=A0AC55DIC5_ECHTE|nr:beta-defensin 121 isoform X2 [Echinops telfairi]
MKLVWLTLAVLLLLSQAVPVTKCWGKMGRCRPTCRSGETFHLLCKTDRKCCVQAKYLPFDVAVSSKTRSQESPPAD